VSCFILQLFSETVLILRIIEQDIVINAQRFSCKLPIIRRLRKNCEKRLLASSCLPVYLSVRSSVHPSVRLSVRLSAWNNSASDGRIFMKFNIWVFFVNLLRKFKFHWNMRRIRGNVPEDVCKFVIISRSFLVRMRNISDKFVEKIRTHIFVLTTFFFYENLAVYELMCKRYGRPRQITDDNIIWHTCFACSVTKSYTHTLAICNTYCFPRQQSLRERVSMWRLCVHCLPCSCHILMKLEFYL
jgi:hypothetical protein